MICSSDILAIAVLVSRARASLNAHIVAIEWKESGGDIFEELDEVTKVDGGGTETEMDIGDDGSDTGEGGGAINVGYVGDDDCDELVERLRFKSRGVWGEEAITRILRKAMGNKKERMCNTFRIEGIYSIQVLSHSHQEDNKFLFKV